MDEEKLESIVDLGEKMEDDNLRKFYEFEELKIDDGWIRVE